MLLYLLPFTQVNAQDMALKVKSLNKLKLYLTGVGAEREQKIATQATLYLGAAVESVVPFRPQGSDGDSDVLGIDHSINFAPVLYFGFRNYYNLKDRNKKRRTTINNSAGYFGFEYDLIAPILINHRYKTKYVSSISPIWGFQKNLSKHFNLELAIGPSFQTDFSYSRVSAFAKFGFSFLL